MAKRSKKVMSLGERLEESLVPKGEIPYDIPKNWVWVKLGGIIKEKPQYGFTTKANNTGDIKFLRTTDITKKEFTWNTVPFCLKKPDKVENYQLKIDDILISRSGSVGENFRIKYLPDNKVVFASYMIRIKPEKVSKYLDYFFKSTFYWKEIKSFSSGNTLKNISSPKIQSIKIPLPPLEEQKRIVKKLEDLLFKLKKSKKLIKEAKESFELRKKAILHKAFSGELSENWRDGNNFESVDILLKKINDEKLENYKKECEKAEKQGKRKPKKLKIKTVKEMKISEKDQPYKLPDGWCWVKLAFCSDSKPYSFVDGPFGSNLKVSDYKEKGVRLIQLQNIKDGYWDNSNKKYITKEKSDQLFKHKVIPGDIVLAKMASPIARATIVPKNESLYIIVADCIKISVNENLDTAFIKYVLNSVVVRGQAEKLGKGTTRKRINLGDTKNLKIPLPPLEEQKYIVEKLEKLFNIEKKIDSLLDMEKNIDLLERSILSKAFRGELGTNCDEDQPAMELLKQILDPNLGKTDKKTEKTDKKSEKIDQNLKKTDQKKEFSKKVIKGKERKLF